MRLRELIPDPERGIGLERGQCVPDKCVVI